MAKKSQTKSNCKKFPSTKETKTTVNKDGVPEYIEGIPTNREAISERKNLIIKYYNDLWKRLQREVNSNYIYNEYWQANIHIVKNESDKKTKNVAVFKWQSVYAIKHLYEVVKKAKVINDNIEIDTPKDGTQRKNGYKRMLILYYNFTDSEHSYLNFTVKLTIGIKANNKHVQYSVNSIDIK